MTRTRVKICGVTRSADAESAARAGADAIGMIFYPKSPRYIEPADAARVRSVIPPYLSVVAVFVNPSPDDVRSVVAAVVPSLLQFHGDEPPEFCTQFGLPFVKAFRVHPELDLLKSLRLYSAAAGWLLDAFVDGYGGGGKSFDWSLIPAQRDGPLILSGGLTPGNVAGAVRQVRPWAVDVSSGVEIRKGIKDPELIERFIQEVRRADA